MRKCSVLLIALIFIPGFSIYADGQKTKEEQLIENVQKICDEIVERSLMPHRLSWIETNDWLLPLYYYLDNAMVPEVQKIAADAIAKLALKARWAQTEECTKFLSEDYPIHVRSAALAVVLAGRTEIGRVGVDAETVEEADRKRREFREKIELQIKKAFIELACGDVMPPYFDSILNGFEYFDNRSHAGEYPRSEYYTLVPEEKRSIFVQRMLQVVKPSGDHEFIWKMISRFPFEIYSKAMKEWYVTQNDPDLRYNCLKYSTLGIGEATGSKGYIKWKKELLEMILSQEWDERIVELAEKSLSKMRSEGFIE